MPTCLVIGASGFLGSALCAEATARGYDLTPVTRATYASAVGAAPDLLFFAAGNSKKYLDDRDPVLAFDLTVAAVRRAIADFRPRRFVLLSSGAVYPCESDPALNAESVPIDPAAIPTRYGFHKRFAELLVLRDAPSPLVLRLGGFVGPGLTKNAVRDILTRGPLYIHPDSALQFMLTRDFARAAFALAETGLGIGPGGLQPPSPLPPILNLSALGTVPVSQIAAWANYPLPPESYTRPLVRAELNLSLASTLLPLPSTAPTVRAFVADVQSGKVVLP
ncbi:MAG: NAD-dependent epimerase/dehydratase family protein [Kiritimatiellae bacterium]|nr:NAD-dependent epimerase/dehydratase family protein [Kiritimatiellia bacterium]